MRNTAYHRCRFFGAAIAAFIGWTHGGQVGRAASPPDDEQPLFPSLPSTLDWMDDLTDLLDMLCRYVNCAGSGVQAAPASLNARASCFIDSYRGNGLSAGVSPSQARSGMKNIDSAVALLDVNSGGLDRRLDGSLRIALGSLRKDLEARSSGVLP